MFMKFHSYYRAHDPAQNGIQVDWFRMRHWPVRNNGRSTVKSVFLLDCLLV